MKRLFLITFLATALFLNAQHMDFSLDYMDDILQATIGAESRSLTLLGKEVVAQVDFYYTQDNVIKCNITLMREEKVVSQPVMQVVWGQDAQLNVADQDGNNIIISIHTHE